MALAKQDCGEQCHPGQRRPANLLKAGKEEVATDLKNRPGVVQMAARDVMTAKVLSVNVDTTLREIAKVLVANGISGVPVLDNDGCPVGMVTERDLIALNASGERDTGQEWWLAKLAEGEPLPPHFLNDIGHPELKARDVMASPVVAVTEDTELSEIARLFIEYRIKRVPVVRNGRAVGIVSRADLVRRMAEDTVAQTPISHRGGLLSEVIASIEEQFTRPRSFATKREEPRSTPITADSLRNLAEDFGHQKAYQEEQKRRAAADRRKLFVNDLIEQHIGDQSWQEILRRAQSAAEAGQKELLLMRFPCELCSDGGRAINAGDAEWPATLRGTAAELFLHWKRDLKPNGFQLVAQVLDFPGGVPGDIGLTLIWGE